MAGAGGNEIRPWTRSLRFLDPHLETQFLESATGIWTKFDVGALIMILAMSPFKLLRSSPVAKFPFYFWTLMTWVAIPVVLLWTIHKFHSFYSRYRLQLVSVARPVIITGCTIMAVTLHDELWKDSAGGAAIIGQMLARTSVMDLVLSSVTLRLTFKRHVVVQFIGVLVSALWIPDLYVATLTNMGMKNEINSMGYTIEGVLARLATMGGTIETPLEFSHYTSWHVVLFLHVLLGFLLPTTMVYCSECWSRAAFLDAHFVNEEGKKKEVALFRKEAFILSVFVLLISAQCCWVLIGSVAEVVVQKKANVCS